MKKNFMKFTKILVLTAMIVSDLMTPIKVFANEISNREPVKGDVGINNKVVNDGNNATIYSGDYETDEALVTKTVTKLDAENGIYNVELRVKGKNREDSTTVTKPVYVVVVFDASGSMICDGAKNGYSYISERDWNVHYTAADGTKITCRGKYNRGEMPNALIQDKWESAVNGAIDFSDSLSKVENTNISLVTFSGSASTATKFSHTALTARDFGHPEGNTNLQAGLSNAIDKLKEITDPNAQKYIVVIGDGQPTSGGSNSKSATDRAMDRAYEAKNDNKITVFSIGYGIENDATAKDVLKKISSDTTMTRVYGYRDYYYEYNKEEKGFYKEANSTGIADSFKTIFEDIKTSVAATNGVLTDVIGDNFKYVEGTKDSQDITVNGKDVTIKVGNITEEEKVYSFNIEIKDKDSATGWYRTNGNHNNNSFTLTGDGLTNPITSSESAEVYWVQNTYNYVINYYKDEITNPNDRNYLGPSDTRNAHKGDAITLNDNDKNAYLADAGNGYEFNSVNPESLVISTDISKNVINVLYTAKKFSYTDEAITKKANMNIVTSLDNKVGYTINYNTTLNNVREDDVVRVTITDTLPQSIDVNNSVLNNGIYNEENNTITWTKIYNIDKYMSTYPINVTIEYMVKYNDYISINGDKLTNIASGIAIVNNTTTDGTEDSEDVNVEIKGTVEVLFKDENTNSEIAPKEELGEKLAGTNYTTSPKEILGYTLNENKLPENKDGKYTEGKITVTYYYTKNVGTVEEPKVEKTGPNTINSIDGVFNYTISGSAKIKDYVGNAKLIVKDMLPYTININKSKLPSTCTYDGNKTITCIKEYNNITEEDYINGVFEVNASFNLELVFIGIDSDKIINKAQTVVDLDGNKIPSKETETETEVLKGSLVVKHISGNTILEVEDTKTNLGGVSYETSAKSFYGYTLDTKTLPDNASGKFVAGSTITVIYNYIKNNGEITENDVTKLQKNQITDINSEYNYVLNYNGKIENYVGEVTLELTDILPYNVVITSMDKRCTLDGKVITCKETYNIDENNQVINESFDIKLRYTNIGSEVTNKVESRLIYGNNEITDEDKVTDKVPYGVVIATYKDTNGNELTTEVKTIDLVGKEYNTEEKDFFGYSLKEINGNENGTYIDDTIYVEYIYTNTMGTGDIEELPPQTGVEQSNLYNYLIIISMLVLSVRGYKKVKETL